MSIEMAPVIWEEVWRYPSRVRCRICTIRVIALKEERISLSSLVEPRACSSRLVMVGAKNIMPCANEVAVVSKLRKEGKTLVVGHVDCIIPKAVGLNCERLESTSENTRTRMAIERNRTQSSGVIFRVKCCEITFQRLSASGQFGIGRILSYQFIFRAPPCITNILFLQGSQNLESMTRTRNNAPYLVEGRFIPCAAYHGSIGASTPIRFGQDRGE